MVSHAFTAGASKNLVFRWCKQLTLWLAWTTFLKWELPTNDSSGTIAATRTPCFQFFFILFQCKWMGSSLWGMPLPTTPDQLAVGPERYWFISHINADRILGTNGLWVWEMSDNYCIHQRQFNLPGLINHSELFRLVSFQPNLICSRSYSEKWVLSIY